MYFILTRYKWVLLQYIAILICLFRIQGVTGINIQPLTWIQGESASVTCTGTIGIAVGKDGVTVTTCRVDLSIQCAISAVFNDTYTSSKANNSVTVNISSVSESRDSGTWTCSGSVITSTNTMVDVKVKPVVHIEPSTSPYKVIQGNQHVLTCTVEEADPPVPSTGYTWSKDGNIITGQMSSIYRIESVERSDSGSYTCTGSNSIGTGRSSTPIQLDVLFAPMVTASADSTTKTEGDNLRLTCTAESNPPPSTFKWYKPDGNIVDVSSNGRLDISNIAKNQGGIYRCEANTTLVPTNGSSITRSESQTINITVLFKPVVHIEPSTSPYKVIQGNQHVLTCTVDEADPSVPSTGYTWSKDGNIITGQSSSIYRIESVERSDSGSYTCTGSNSIGTGRSSTPVQLDVLFGLMVIVSAESLPKTEGDHLQLTCTVDSNPPPTIFKWYKPDGSVVIYSNGRLDISNITRNQSGIYRCEAETTLKPTSGSPITRSNSTTINITVPYLDRVIIAPDVLTVNEGNSTSTTCSTNSNPVALITWYNGTTQISSKQSNVDTFNIQQATCLDTGDYTCTATNTKLPDVQYNQLLQLYVQCSPRQDTRVITTSIVSGNITDMVQLVADVISYPPPTFTWYYNNITTGDVEPIYNDDVFKHIDTSISVNTYRSTLNINIASNIYYTSYIVNVSNNIGYTQLEYQVIHQYKPDRPSNINTLPPSDDSICITWTPGFNGGDQQKFIVQHSVDNKTWTSSTPLPESDYCMQNLQADTSYYIRVIARNKYGDSQPMYLSVIAPSVRTMKKVSSNGDVKKESQDGVVVGLSVLMAFVIIISILAVLSAIYYRRKYQQILKGSEIPTSSHPTTTGYNNNGLMSTYEGLELGERNPTEGTYQELIQNSTNVDDSAINRIEDPTYINTRSRI